MGKLVATTTIILKKCCLNSLMETSATLFRWQFYSTSSSAKFCLTSVFMLSEHSLSIIWHFGVMPVDLIMLMRVMYPL